MLNDANKEYNANNGHCNVGKPRRSCPGSACLDTGLASGQTRCGGQASRRHARLAKRVGPRADFFVV